MSEANTETGTPRPEPAGGISAGWKIIIILSLIGSCRSDLVRRRDLDSSERQIETRLRRVETALGLGSGGNGTFLSAPNLEKRVQALEKAVQSPGNTGPTDRK